MNLNFPVHLLLAKEGTSTLNAQSTPTGNRRIDLPKVKY